MLGNCTSRGCQLQEKMTLLLTVLLDGDCNKSSRLIFATSRTVSASFVSLYRISLNKHPGRLFKNGLSRGEGLIQGGHLIKGKRLIELAEKRTGLLPYTPSFLYNHPLAWLKFF